ncbi:oligosaccharide flippase family protein [Candidatus Peregrinibacteria bacterium]|nr:oligosaccharide flippase family protein [Candidatus Peregrinibacteria bacterium]
MLKHFKQTPFFELLKHSKNYFLSNLATGALAFLSMPVMTRLLSPHDYGVLAVFTGYQGIFIALLTLNCYVALGRYYYEKKEDFKEFFGTNLIFVLFLLVLAFLFFMIFREQAASILGLPSNTIVYIVPAVLIYVSGSWFEQLYMPQKESRKIAVRNIFRAYGIFTLSVVIILFLNHEKYLGQIYGMMIIGTLFFFYYIFELKSYLKLSFQLKHVRYILHYSVPLLLYSLSGVILAQFDKIMVNRYLGSDSAGLYAFAAVVGSILTIISSAMFQAWNPDYFAHMDSKNYNQLNSDAYKIFKIIMICALFLILFGQEIGMILASKNFYDALPVIPIIVIGYIFNSIFAFYGWNIEYEKKNIYLSMVVLAAGAINIFLNMLFIPKFGYIAAAYTTAVSYFAMAFLAWFTSKCVLKIYCVPIWPILQSFFIIALLLIIYFMISLLPLHFGFFLLIKFLFCLIGAALLCGRSILDFFIK